MTEEFNTQRDEKTDSRHNLTWHMMDINRQKREKADAAEGFYHLDERIVRCRKVYDSKCTGEASVCNGEKNDAFGWR